MATTLFLSKPCPEETHIQMIQNQEPDEEKTIGDDRLEVLSSFAGQKERNKVEAGGVGIRMIYKYRYCTLHGRQGQTCLFQSEDCVFFFVETRTTVYLHHLSGRCL
jgi:hypothetical protein